MNLRPAWSSRIVLSALLGAALASPEATAQAPISESEPNGTPATATALPSVATCQAASGTISPIGDLDYYSFTAPAGSRLWALVDTGGSTTSRDSLLTLFGPDGTTVIEADDDDAQSADCDATVEAVISSTIAGRTLVTGGTYFLRVERSKGGATITPYRLLVAVTSSASSEIEPNNTIATANPIVSGGSLNGVRDAAIAPGDVDVYSVVVPAGATTLFISADQDPDKNLSGTDVVVELIAPDGSTVLRTVDKTDSGGFPPPGAESFCFGIGSPGTYFVRVFGAPAKNVTGNYSLMVAVCGVPITPTATPTATRTPTQTATSIVGGPTATPTPTQPPGTATATATRTATVAPSATPIGGVVPSDIPTLTFPMLLVMALGLLTAAFLVIRRT